MFSWSASKSSKRRDAQSLPSTSTTLRINQDRPYRINSISTMSSRSDSSPSPCECETTTFINEPHGQRVRIALDNGQYFVLKIPEELDGNYYEITSNEAWKLFAKFEGFNDSCPVTNAIPSISYESALSRGNAVLLICCLLQSLLSGVRHLEFYLCVVGMVTLYGFYHVACGRVSKVGEVVNLCKLTLKTVKNGASPEVKKRLPVISETTQQIQQQQQQQQKQQQQKQSIPSSKSDNTLTKRSSASAKDIESSVSQTHSSTSLPSSSSQPSLPTQPLIPLPTPPPSSLIPPPSTWIHSPLLIRTAPLTPTKIDGHACTPTSQLRVNALPIPFETDLFEGVAMIRIANIPDAPASYFGGRNRKMQVAIQGSFKKRTSFDKVFSGQEFSQKIPSLPPKSVVDTVFALLSSKLPPTFLQDVFADEPYFLSPLVNTCQGFAVERKGTQQSVAGTPENKYAVEENTLLLGDEVPKTGEKRRKFFAIKKNLERYNFEPALVYTFDYYQHYMDMSSMKFIVTSFLSFDVSSVLGKQPMQLSMAKNMGGEGYYWNFEVWHKSLFDDKGKKN